MRTKAELIEVFSGIQGEGPIVGRRQIFVRFGRCDVVCDYCDTPLCHVTLEKARIEATPGKRDFASVANPVEATRLLDGIVRLDAPRGGHHSVSFTGGEPLLQADVISELAPALRDRGLAIYLETNGHLVDELGSVVDRLDIVGMDIKIESTTGFPERYGDNRRFLALALEAGCEVFVKIVVGEDTRDEELTAALDVVRSVDAGVPVVLMPVTPFRGAERPPTPDRLLALSTLAGRVVPDVSVIPQTHKMLGQL